MYGGCSLSGPRFVLAFSQSALRLVGVWCAHPHITHLHIITLAYSCALLYTMHIHTYTSAHSHSPLTPMSAVIEANAATLRVLETVQERMKKMNIDELSRFTLDNRLGGMSEVIYYRVCASPPPLLSSPPLIFENPNYKTNILSGRHTRAKKTHRHTG